MSLVSAWYAYEGIEFGVPQTEVHFFTRYETENSVGAARYMMPVWVDWETCQTALLSGLFYHNESNVTGPFKATITHAYFIFPGVFPKGSGMTYPSLVSGCHFQLKGELGATAVHIL